MFQCLLLRPWQCRDELVESTRPGTGKVAIVLAGLLALSVESDCLVRFTIDEPTKAFRSHQRAVIGR